MTLSDPSVPTIATLQLAYRRGDADPLEVIERLLERIEHEPGSEAWILRREPQALLAEAEAACRRLRADPTVLERQPLLGIPFAVKDNIDVAGLPTSAACPAFARSTDRDATVVSRLIDAGAILVGKTNLDQFATGLTGTRSPHGAVGNPFDTTRMSGGSSSGSAAATARGWVAFALGTDTAGSGRVPAGACNLVGLKPTPGLISTSGVLPACRSLDCVSVFAHTVADAWTVLGVMAGPDVNDAWQKPVAMLPTAGQTVRVGIPQTPDFADDALAARAWDEALRIVQEQPGVVLESFDLAPFTKVAELLYDGPWVAERRAALGEFFHQHGDTMDPAVRAVIARADSLSAADAFRGQYRLSELRRSCHDVMASFDALLVPTAPTLWSHDEIDADPIGRNSVLGTYTNFVNLLDMAALALPGPFRADGLPAGVTLLGAAGADWRLAELGRRWQGPLHRRLGLGNLPPPGVSEPLPMLPHSQPPVTVAVVGAHLSGQPLNHQLTERGATLLERANTAPTYRLFELPGTEPRKPGLVQVALGGAAITVELWSMPASAYGSFVAGIPAPLGIGTLSLADGRQVQGFLCEALAARTACDITAHGSWPAYLQSLTAATPQ